MKTQLLILETFHSLEGSQRAESLAALLSEYQKSAASFFSPVLQEKTSRLPHPPKA